MEADKSVKKLLSMNISSKIEAFYKKKVNSVGFFFKTPENNLVDYTEIRRSCYKVCHFPSFLALTLMMYAELIVCLITIAFYNISVHMFNGKVTLTFL